MLIRPKERSIDVRKHKPTILEAKVPERQTVLSEPVRHTKLMPTSANVDTSSAAPYPMSPESLAP